MTIDDVKLGSMVYGVNVVSPVISINNKRYRNYVVGKVVYIDTHGRWVTIQTPNYKTCLWLSEAHPYTGRLPRIAVNY